MRVIGGTSRGRKLSAPPGSVTRPTSDRVRESIFDILGSLSASGRFRWEEAEVWDLFAGTGALGIEALSRGAAAAVLVDQDRAAVDSIAANLVATGLEGPRARVERAEVLRWLAAPPPGPVDLVLCDPPYDYGDWAGLLEGLSRAQARLVVLESDRPLATGPAWTVLKHKRYGGTLVTVLEKGTP